MICTVCGREIPSIYETDTPEEANYLQMENRDIVCTDRECRIEHMKMYAGEEEKANYFADCAEQGITGLAELAAGGLDGLPPWELDEMLEWYESGNTFEKVNETWYSDWIA